MTTPSDLPAKPRRLRIAILGTRGAPATYGGFETFAEELGARLAARGHRVTVYGRSHFVPAGLREYRAMRLRVLPTIRHKYLDTVVHTALSVIDTLPRRFDIALICNVANAPFAFVPRLVGTHVVLNLDGLEWKRGKWGPLGQGYYRLCSWIAPKLPITLVSDAQVIADYYRQRYGKTTAHIPYGTDGARLAGGAGLRELGLEADRYLLYVSRLEPENNAHVVIDAYRRARLEMPLVIVGDAPYADDYKAHLREMAPAGVKFTGYVFGAGYAELQSNALAYIQATEVGGTHPALVEAMGRGAAIIANDVPEHREVLAETGLYYARNDPDDLARQLRILADDQNLRQRIGELASERAIAEYSWERVTDKYVQLFQTVIEPKTEVGG
jgi:glycosyltransferase involved in cell wall biosynthesis